MSTSTCVHTYIWLSTSTVVSCSGYFIYICSQFWSYTCTVEFFMVITAVPTLFIINMYIYLFFRFCHLHGRVRVHFSINVIIVTCTISLMSTISESIFLPNFGHIQYIYICPNFWPFICIFFPTFGHLFKTLPPTFDHIII
jgi:hypothetical protein